MTKTLVIVESPAKAKTIGKILGKNYEVAASLGHVRDLPKSQFGVDIENDFQMKYITIRGKGDLIKDLRKKASKADKILLASDPDREGEAIAWHLQEILKLDKDSDCRITFNEITKDAVKSAVKSPRRIDEDLVDAQQARRALDRLVGYQLSPLLWRKVKKGLSAGRVQSAVLRLICEREEEINAFEPKEYWTLESTFQTENKEKLTAKLNKYQNKKLEIASKEEMDRILADLKGRDYQVSAVKTQDKLRNPAAPFITSTLQQEAARKLGFTARRTMRAAQSLYEGVTLGRSGSHGLITYMRTDSTRIAEVAQAEARKFIETNYGVNFLPPSVRQYKNKNNAQNAHEAIRPTDINRTPESIKEYLSNDEYKLYRLIWARFLASQMASAKIKQTSAAITAGEYEFSASGAIVTFKGFLEVYEEGHDDKEEDAKMMAQVSEGELLKHLKDNPKQHFTQAPPRYTEATLIKTLEENGVGRPSTYAPIIDTLSSRNYVTKENKQFCPTELGNIVVEMLEEYFPNIVNVKFTASLESQLDEVEEGKVSWKAVLGGFYPPFAKELARAEEEIGQMKIEDEVTDVICEKCGRNMVIKMGKHGKFLACPGYPECVNAKPLLEKIGVPCPKCGGEIVKRRSKKGRVFYGCSNYPECDFSSWDLPVKEKCPKCGSYMVQKGTKQGKFLICSNEECNYKQKVGEQSE